MPAYDFSMWKERIIKIMKLVLEAQRDKLRLNFYKIVLQTS